MNTPDIIIIFNLFIIEALLSVDNAAVLAVMVKDLPDNQRPKALRYGLFGAYAFRFMCLFFVSFLVGFWWLKILGGTYLVYLTYGHFSEKNDSIEEPSSRGDSKIFNFASRIGMSSFWATVALVEVMDLAFSIDNIFAAVALSDKIWVIMAGVGVGMLAMRFVAGWFVKMMDKYPSLGVSAFVVIALLGFKLIVGGLADGFPDKLDTTKAILDSHVFDLTFSGTMMLIFFTPLFILKNK